MIFISMSSTNIIGEGNKKENRCKKEQPYKPRQKNKPNNEIGKYFYKFSDQILNQTQTYSIEAIIQYIRKLYTEDIPIIQTFRVNYIFYLTTLICLAAISYYSGTNYFWTIITLITVSFLGYLTHYVSHSFKVTEVYKNLNNGNYITNNKIIHRFLMFICKCADFHDEIHHNPFINKTFSNIALEFLFNFYTQAGAFLVIMYCLKNMNYYSVILWGLMYPTIHLINYDIIKCRVHQKHHLDKHSNYGIDIWDILFNTKYKGDNSDIEDINHYSFNVIVITTLMVIYLTRYR
jgi:hypothetical protein